VLLRKPMVFGIRSAQQMEFDEARQLAEIGLTRRPKRFERLLGALLHLKTIHRDKHFVFSCLSHCKAEWPVYSKFL
jgi:hypothetical protein